MMSYPVHRVYKTPHVPSSLAFYFAVTALVTILALIALEQNVYSTREINDGQSVAGTIGFCCNLTERREQAEK